jgi:type II secretory pathway pseudopilin PulG
MMQPEYKARKYAAFTLLEFSLVLVALSLMTSYSAASAAFTLIEVCVVLVVFAVLGGAVLGKVTQDTRRAKEKSLQESLARIETALKIFATQYNRLPCPSNPAALRDTDIQFGVEAGNPGDCNADSPPDGVAWSMHTYFLELFGVRYSEAVEGSVPVRTLAQFGTLDDDAFDPWGGQVDYVVTKKATMEDALRYYGPADQLGAITVLDASGLSRTTSAIALLLSYGANGHGAYQLSGMRRSSGSTDPDELENCHCDSNAAHVGGFAAYVLRGPLKSGVNSTFDDEGEYFLRSNFKASGTPLPLPSPNGCYPVSDPRYDFHSSEPPCCTYNCIGTDCATKIDPHTGQPYGVPGCPIP